MSNRNNRNNRSRSRSRSPSSLQSITRSGTNTESNSNSRTVSRSRSMSDVRTDSGNSRSSKTWTGTDSGTEGSGTESDSQNDSHGDSSMTSFFNYVADTTLSVLQKRRNRRGGQSVLKRTAHDQQVYDAVCDLSDEILDEWKSKVEDAADKGFTNTNIYEFEKGAKYKGFPVALLVSGPREEPHYFKDNGTFSVVEELQFEPDMHRFRVETRFIKGKNGNSDKNVIIVDWRSGIFVQ